MSARKVRFAAELALWKRLGFKRAATALARKMAVVLHAMWKSATPFDPTFGVATP